MKLLSHSNGIHKVDKDKVSKRKIFKKMYYFFYRTTDFWICNTNDN